MMGNRRKNEYKTIKIPLALAEKIDNFIDENKEYTSRSDVIKQALRNFLKD